MADFTNSMATRMRRTFRYPEDLEDENGNGNGTREELDEEEQESVIKELRKQDEQWNTVYKLMFTLLPFLSGVAFVPALLDTEYTIYQKSLCLLCVASLLATAYIVKYHTLRVARHEDKTTRHPHPERTPASNYIFISNTSACIFLAVMGYMMKSNSDTEDILWILYLTPGVVFAIALVVKRESSSADIEELEKLRYEYKGA